MTQAIFRALASDKFEIESAGVEPWDDCSMEPRANHGRAPTGRLS